MYTAVIIVVIIAADCTITFETSNKNMIDLHVGCCSFQTTENRIFPNTYKCIKRTIIVILPKKSFNNSISNKLDDRFDLPIEQHLV